MSRLRQQRMRARKAKAFRRRMIALVVIVLIVASLGAVYYFGNRSTSGTSPEPIKVLLRTSMGDITIQLYDDMPITTGNFKNLVKQGVYDGTIFHRVVPNFVVQGGDASAKGISVTTIRDELPNKHTNEKGSVAMAKTYTGGAVVPNSATSQFYINLKDNSESLDSNYSVFGMVSSGMNVVDAIGNVPTDTTTERPLQDVTLTSAKFIP